MQFYENDLINEVIDNYIQTWSHTLDAGDFVKAKYLDKLDNLIFKKMKCKFKEVEIYRLIYLQERGFKLSVFQRLKIYFSGLKPLYLADKSEQEENLEN